MIYFGNLKKKLKKIAIKQIITSLFFISIFFAISIMLYTNINSYFYTQQSLQEVNDLFVGVYKDNKDFLMSNKIRNIQLNASKNPQDYQALDNTLNRLNANNITETNVIILDENLDINYSTFSDQRETDLRINYTKAISNKTQTSDGNVVYNSVYKISRGFPDLMMTRRLTVDNEVTAYITMFVSGYDWSYYLLSNFNSDSVITDLDGNIIFYSKPSLMSNKYKFEPKGFNIKIEGENFSVLSNTMQDYNIKVYSLNSRGDSNLILYSIVFIIVIGFIWYRYSNKIADTVIEDNIGSINSLVSQINLIADSREKRIEFQTNDEYEYVAREINTMLDRIETLNEKNTELIQLNNLIEIKQLLSQYNPHFLYNTLEIIRSASHWAPEISDKLIIKLTNILKYSIDSSKQDVKLREDMNYIQDYLDIQKTRFEDRFNCVSEISDAAYESTVIKLLLQPVIENSIKYGFKVKQSINIEIKGYVENEILVLKVTDDGPGMSLEEIENINRYSGTQHHNNASLGLYNIARRLHLQYSEKSGIKITNNEKEGITVEIKVAQNKEKGE